MTPPVVLRDGAGRFRPGTVGGPGRRPRRDLRGVIESATNSDVDSELADVATVLFGLAKKGDVQAAGLLLRHLVVAAPSAIELEVEADAPNTEEVARRVMDALASAAARDDRVAAQLAVVALRAAPSEQLRDVAAALDRTYPDSDPKELNDAM